MAIRRPEALAFREERDSSAGAVSALPARSAGLVQAGPSQAERELGPQTQ